jgi:dTDP-4-amino-4,6-dideoxygalactose transaminase
MDSKQITWVPNKHVNTIRVSELLEDSIKTRQFTNYGPNVRKLEALVQNILKIDHTKAVVCVSNATHGIWATISSFEMFYNKSLICATQSLTFPASAQGYLKDSRILDIDDSGGLNLELVSNEDCVILTNIFGNTVDISKYEKWQTNTGKLLVFDNAATPYSFYKGTNSCNFGNASIVSFHHTKPIGFGEGGCIIIDKKYETCLRKVINFGFDEHHIWHSTGSNYKMSDIQATYIIQHLERFDSIKKKHMSLYDYFISKIPKHIKMFPNTSEISLMSCFCILLDNSHMYMDRLIENNIQVRKYYEPLISTPIADYLFSKILCIPCNTDMTEKDIDKIIDLLSNE